MPDFLDYNPSRASLQLARKADAERKREQRAKGARAVDHDANGRFRGNGISHREYTEDE